jgi:hypothetical protein
MRWLAAPDLQALPGVRASARSRNPAGVRGIFKVRKLSPGQFGVIRRSLNAIRYERSGKREY